MSFSRLIFKILVPEKITFSLNDIPKALKFITELTEGKYVSKIEKHEFDKSKILAKKINSRAELLSLLQAVMSSDKGEEIRETLFEHRELIHSLYNNKTHVLGELSKIIVELEIQVKLQERRKGLRSGPPDVTIQLPGGGEVIVK